MSFLGTNSVPDYKTQVFLTDQLLVICYITIVTYEHFCVVTNVQNLSVVNAGIWLVMNLDILLRENPFTSLVGFC